jgi:VIT1/CCC1 family predicted Fe2+/Mn2+ transporter
MNGSTRTDDTPWMDSGTRTGLFFGLTSGVITTLGLIAGLQAGADSVVVVISGVLIIALADSMSDALGVHVAREAEPEATSASVWKATFATLFSKLAITLSFVAPVMLLPEFAAIVASAAWAFLVLAILSYFIARSQGSSFLLVAAEHITIAVVVLLGAHWIGQQIHAAFY